MLDKASAEPDIVLVDAESSQPSRDERSASDDFRQPSARNNKLRVCATWLSFFLFGMGDGAIGALLPTVQEFYGISYTLVSILFLCQIIGYGVMGLFTQSLLSALGRRWGSLTACLLVAAGYTIVLPGPPFGVVVFAYFLIGFALGIFESMLNAWAGSLRESAFVLSCLHGFYGLGAAVSPILATQMVAHGIIWHYYYAVLLFMALSNLALSFIAFWGDTRQVLQAEEASASARHVADTAQSMTQMEKQGQQQQQPQDSVTTTTTTPIGSTDTLPERSVRHQVMHNTFCLIWALHMFLYLGTEISAGGWLSQYMQKVRGASEQVSGYVNSGFWFGLTAGRFLLSWPASHYLGEWWACQVLLGAALAFELLFWLARGSLPSSIGITFVGFFIGPIFPLVVGLATKHLDPKLHVTAIGLVCAFGSIGAAVLPFVIGIASTAETPKVVPYFITSLLAGCLLMGFVLPGRTPTRLGQLLRRK